MLTSVRTFMTAVVAVGIIGWVGVGPAGASSAPSVTSGSAAVAELQSEYRANASAQDYASAVAAYGNLVQTGATSSSERALSRGTVQPDWTICRSTPKYAVIAFAWYVIFGGGATAAVEGFLDITIVGIPAGAVLNAIGVGYGVTGNALLYWTDHTSWPKSVCYRVRVGW